MNPARRPFLRVEGGGTSRVRHARQNLELRVEFAEAVVVRVEQRVRGQWRELFSGESADMGLLLNIRRGCDVRIAVAGESVGYAELREVH